MDKISVLDKMETKDIIGQLGSPGTDASDIRKLLQRKTIPGKPREGTVVTTSLNFNDLKAPSAAQTTQAPQAPPTPRQSPTPSLSFKPAIKITRHEQGGSAPHNPPIVPGDSAPKTTQTAPVDQGSQEEDDMKDIINPAKVTLQNDRSEKLSEVYKMPQRQDVKLPSNIDFGLDKLVNKDVMGAISDGDKNSHIAKTTFQSKPKKPVISNPTVTISPKLSPRNLTQIDRELENLKKETSEPKSRPAPKESHVKKSAPKKREDLDDLEDEDDLDDEGDLDDLDEGDLDDLDEGDLDDLEDEGDLDDLEADGDEGNLDARSDQGSQGSQEGSEPMTGKSSRRTMSRHELQVQKRTELTKIERLEKKGYKPCKKFSMSDNLDEIIEERKRLEDDKGCDESIKWQRKIIMGISTGIEFLNKTYDPFDLHLDGWSESVYENISDYDEVFEELYHKYKTQVQVGPEIKLLGMFAGSALMFHFSKTLFQKASGQVPGFSDVMNANPDLSKAYQQAALKQVNMNSDQANNATAKSIGGFFGNPMLGNLLGGLMGSGGAGGSVPPKIPTARPTGPSGPISLPKQTPSRPQTTSKKPVEMEGPSGVDALLESLTTGTNAEHLKEIQIADLDTETNLSELASGVKNITFGSKKTTKAPAKSTAAKRRLNLSAK